MSAALVNYELIHIKIKSVPRLSSYQQRETVHENKKAAAGQPSSHRSYSAFLLLGLK